MNDIQLVSSGTGTFDWNFDKDDLVNVNGNQRLLSAVIHAVLLRRGELDLVLYAGRGCDAHRYTKLTATRDNILKLEQSITAEVNGISGVQSSTVCVGDNLTITEIKILKDDGREVTINAIPQ